MFPSSSKMMEAPTLFAPLERANLNYWLVLLMDQQSNSPSFFLMMKTDPVSETHAFWNIRQWIKSKNLVSPSTIHHQGAGLAQAV
jgi:hypothetical protein